MSVEFVSLDDIDRDRVSCDEGDCLVVTDQRDQKQGPQSQEDRDHARSVMIAAAQGTGLSGWLAVEDGPEYVEKYKAWFYRIRAYRYKKHA